MKGLRQVAKIFVFIQNSIPLITTPKLEDSNED